MIGRVQSADRATTSSAAAPVVKGLSVKLIVTVSFLFIFLLFYTFRQHLFNKRKLPVVTLTDVVV